MNRIYRVDTTDRALAARFPTPDEARRALSKLAPDAPIVLVMHVDDPEPNPPRM